MRTEGEDVVHSEIPNGHTSDCNEFAQIEMPVQFIMKQVYDQVVEPQANEGNEDERTILPNDLSALALKSPHTIPEVVIRCGKHKAQRIAEILVPFQFLFSG